MLNRIQTGKTDLPPLLMAHGLYGQARNLGVVAKGVADLRHVTSVDMRNHGESPWTASHGYEEMAADLAGMIPQRSDVLGHSMGGKAAMALALSSPDKVNRLIVADIAPIRYEHGQAEIISAMQRLDLTAITRRAEAAAMLAKDPAVGPDVAGFLTQSLDLGAKRWKMNLDLLAAELPRILGFPRFETQFEGPTLFLAGANSDYVRENHRQEISRLFPRARVVRIKSAGHWLHADAPEAVVTAIRGFLGATA